MNCQKLSKFSKIDSKIVSSCTFHSVGTAAGEQKFNSLCILSLNIINEKVKFESHFNLVTYTSHLQVYLLLWFWLFGLTILTATHLMFRLVTILMPPVRRLLIIIKSRGFSDSDMNTTKSVLSHCYLGDWFVLYQLSKNSNTYFFRYLLKLMDASFTSQACRLKNSLLIQEAWTLDNKIILIIT